MTDQGSFLSVAARKEVIAGIDRALAVFEKTGKYLTSDEEKVRVRLRELRHQAEEQFNRPPEGIG